MNVIMVPDDKGKQRPVRIALMGNPNSGKTSVFNQLTGSNQKVGNWSGVTVEVKEGRVALKHGEAIVVDLPGTYSLSACSQDESVAREYLLNASPDCVINVIDSTNLERQLYLTMQLLELGIRPVLALNMWDEVRQKGIGIDCKLLSSFLGVQVIPTNGRTGEGVREMFEAACTTCSHPTQQLPFTIPYSAEIEAACGKLNALLSPSITGHYPIRWFVLQLLERDRLIEVELLQKENGAAIIAIRDKIVIELKRVLGDDPQTRIVEERYGFIAGAVREAVCYPATDRLDMTQKIDALLTHRFWAFPLFFIFMWLLFQATFKFGGYPMHWIELLFGWLGTIATTSLSEGIFRSLLVDGIIAGIGGVIVFLPNILILFLGISIMEDTGYMARAAFITDKLMHRIGLHGKSFIPMIMGLGCSVPAIMAARTLESPKDRIKTILLTPLISCSARLPVFVLFAGALFPKHAGNVVFLFQVILSFSAFCAMALLFKHTLFRGTEDYPFVMELPPYRMPTVRSILMHLWQKTRHYLEKMGGVVLIFSIVLWWAGNYPKAIDAERVYNEKTATLASDESLSDEERHEQNKFLKNDFLSARMAHSYIGQIGSLLEPLVRPFGSDWRGAVSLVTGFVAKEIVVGSMGVLYAVGTDADEREDHLRNQVRKHFTPLSGLSFMLFVLLYTPCLVAFLTVIRELKNWRWSLFSLGYQLMFAWCMATLVYQSGNLFFK